MGLGEVRVKGQKGMVITCKTCEDGLVYVKQREKEVERGKQRQA